MTSNHLTNIKEEPEDSQSEFLDCSQGDDNSSRGEASTSEQCESGKTTPHAAKYVAPYSKRRILELLMKKGCSASSYNQSIATFQIDRDFLRDLYNKRIQQAVEYVGEECDSLCFSNISDWLVLMKEISFNEFCDYEPSLIMKAIASNEEQPSPDTMGGIDLKAIYNFLGNVLMGHPQVKLNDESANFLANEFESLINDVNEVDAEFETKLIKDILESDATCESDMTKLRAKLSLDPLDIDAALINLL